MAYRRRRYTRGRRTYRRYRRTGAIRKRYYRRRYNRKRRYSTKRTPRIGKLLSRMGDKIVKMTHVVVYNVPGSSVKTWTAPAMLQTLACKANSCNHPFPNGPTLMSGDPEGYRYWSNYYDHWTVVKSKYTMEVNQYSTASASTRRHSVVFGVKLNDEPSISSTANWWTIRSDPLTKLKTFHFDGSGSKRIRISQWYTPKKFWGSSNTPAIPVTTPTGAQVEGQTGSFDARTDKDIDIAMFIPWGQLEDPNITPPDDEVSLEFKCWVTYWVKLQEPKNMDELSGDVNIAQTSV